MSDMEKQFESIKNNGLLWISMERPTSTDMSILGQKYAFQKLNLDDCLSKI